MSFSIINTKNRDIRKSGGFIVVTLSLMHGLFHTLDQTLVILLPEIKATFGLSVIGVGIIAAVERTSDSIISAPAGIFSDMHRSKWGLILALCVLLFGLGWLVVGTAQLFPVLLTGIAMIAVASSVWHLPATASLSEHFPTKRATVLSIHAIGGNIGDIIGPLITTGILLSFFTWRGIITSYAIIPILLVVIVLWAFKKIGEDDQAKYITPTLHNQLILVKQMLGNRVLWGINLVNALRNMTYVSLVWFLPIYFDQELHMSFQSRGFHMGLLFLVGLFSTPLLGYLSDRYGRKEIIVPSLLVLCILTLLLVSYGQGILLTLLIIGISLFLYGDQPILTAAALDIVGHDVINTALGVLSLARLVPSVLAPIIAGWLYQNHGIDALFYFVAGIFAISAIIFTFLPLTSFHSIANNVSDHKK